LFARIFMAYSDFTLGKVKTDLNLVLDETRNLFKEVEEINPSALLRQTLDEYIPLATAISTEKARSELLIAPILTEVRRQAKYQVSLFSGSEFNVDPSKGLTGFCDFILSGSREQFDIIAPVITITEAKNENIKSGLGQCIAAMFAAQIFNRKVGNNVKTIYGAVTTGTTWRFITLEGNSVFIDSVEYYIDRVDKILGILFLPVAPFLV